MNRYKFSEERVYCKLCDKEPAVKWSLCISCAETYLAYYNFTLKDKRSLNFPMTPEKYIAFKKREKKMSLMPTKVKTTEFWRDVNAEK